jgi:hypothetical protein
MSTMLDIVGSVVIFGILALTIARVQVNIQNAVYENSASLIAQSNATQLAKQLEYDLTKIGYRVPSGQQKILFADTAEIRFKADLQNNGTIHTVRYRTGTINEATETINPFDFPLKRTDNFGEIVQLWGLVRFRFWYYDSLHNMISTPVTHNDSLKKIYAINTLFVVEAREPGSITVDTTYYSITWEKLTYPRNLRSF